MQSRTAADGGAHDGAAFACSGRSPSSVYRSTDGGATWARFGTVTDEPGTWATALDELPATATLPTGRLVAGAAGGVAYSDDGGATWTRSSLWGVFQWWVNDLLVVPDAGHPYGGTVYAALLVTPDGVPAVHASEDGGATWAVRHAFAPGDLLNYPAEVVLAAGPDGTLYAGLRDASFDVGTFARSVDGGRTWEEIEAGYGGAEVRVVIVGRDGRLYAGTEEGVWRTVAPLPVASDPPPASSEEGLGLAVAPNPSGGTAQVTFTLAAPATVRLTVLDALGREVAVLADGRQSAGPHAVRFDGAGLPAGVYVVRIEVADPARGAEGTVATARLTLSR